MAILGFIVLFIVGLLLVVVAIILGYMHFLYSGEFEPIPILIPLFIGIGFLTIAYLECPFKLVMLSN